MGRRLETVKDLVKSFADSDAAERQKHGLVDAPEGTSLNPSTKIFTIPNVITFIRFGLTIAFLVLFLRDRLRWEALACYAIAALTDFLDGWIARKTQSVSWLGKVMDPIMDRLLLVTGVLALLLSHDLPLWVPVYVIGRDLYLTLGAVALQHYRARPVDVTYVGKAATASLMFGFFDLLFGLPVVDGLGLVNVYWLPGLNSAPCAVGIFFVYLGVCLSVAAAIIYTYRAIQIIDEARAANGASE